MFELRFFEIYRSSEYVNLLIEGLLLSTSLTIASGIIGFLLAFILAALRYLGKIEREIKSNSNINSLTMVKNLITNVCSNSWAYF